MKPSIKLPLNQVGVIEGDEELTPLGYHLAKLPVDVLIGKMQQSTMVQISVDEDYDSWFSFMVLVVVHTVLFAKI
ncbi:hypothetical protein FRX31_034255 [Thalictrum thalictroides]|uniref:Helicase associated domain-containing protein n=1 Tax=Thalictrum thalictroides TaxID=46969 RepID=A0A7J6UUL7_THATH|nr:hypothetical protein FRX31_034255 [Thalictrum thalictroides]